MITAFIAGHCAPQGSKRHLGNGVMIESCKRVKGWRSDVRAALIDDRGQPRAYFDGPVHVDVAFVMPRPKSAPKKREPAADKKPDIDKLLRAVLDSVSSSGVWRDDSQVVSVISEKRIAKLGETPGCHLLITNAMDFRKKDAA